MSRFGGMVSFLAAGGRDAAVAICEATQLFTLAESLGGVESLIEHPAPMTHAGRRFGTRGARRPGAAVGRHRNGDDLLADLARALG